MPFLITEAVANQIISTKVYLRHENKKKLLVWVIFFFFEGWRVDLRIYAQ